MIHQSPTLHLKPLSRDQYKREAAVKLGPGDGMQKAENAALAFGQLAADAPLDSALYLKTNNKAEERFSQNGASVVKKLKRWIKNSLKTRNEKLGAGTRATGNIGQLNTHASSEVRAAANQLVQALTASKHQNSDKVRFDTAVKNASTALTLAILQHRYDPQQPQTEQSLVDNDSTSQKEDQSATNTSDDSQHTQIFANTTAVAKPVVVTKAQPVQATVAPQPMRIGCIEPDEEGEDASYLDDGLLPHLSTYIGKAPLGSVLSVYEDDKRQLMLKAEPVAPGQPSPQPHPNNTGSLCMTLEHLMTPFSTHDDWGVRGHANKVLRLVQESKDSGQPLTISEELKDSVELVYRWSSPASS